MLSFRVWKLCETIIVMSYFELSSHFLNYYFILISRPGYFTNTTTSHFLCATELIFDFDCTIINAFATARWLTLLAYRFSAFYRSPPHSTTAKTTVIRPKPYGEYASFRLRQTFCEEVYWWFYLNSFAARYLIYALICADYITLEWE
jgi:hypothetical protein